MLPVSSLSFMSWVHIVNISQVQSIVICPRNVAKLVHKNVSQNVADKNANKDYFFLSKYLPT